MKTICVCFGLLFFSFGAMAAPKDSLEKDFAKLTKELKKICHTKHFHNSTKCDSNYSVKELFIDGSKPSIDESTFKKLQQVVLDQGKEWRDAVFKDSEVELTGVAAELKRVVGVYKGKELLVYSIKYQQGAVSKEEDDDKDGIQGTITERSFVSPDLKIVRVDPDAAASFEEKDNKD